MASKTGIILVAVIGSLRPTVGAAAYCLPGNSCWPPASAWNALSVSVGGRLSATLHWYLPCVLDSSSAQCSVVMGNISNPIWHADQPGGMQNLNAEWADPTSPNPSTDPPQLSPSSIPAYHIQASSPSDVQAALAFVQKYNVRLVIKSSGHEQTARSNSGGALLLWMRFFASAAPTINASFQNCVSESPVPAMTVPAGQSWDVALTTALSSNYHVVAGDCHSVCGAGGFILAGGHSVSSPSYGLGVDNVLEFQVVLANGTIATVSSCSYPDLFWALKGSGGPMAVLLSVTYKLHPIQPVTHWHLRLSLNNLSFGPTLIDKLLQFHLLAVNSSMPGGGFWQLGQTYQHDLVFSAPLSATNVSLPYTSLVDWLSAQSDVSVDADSLTEYPSFIAWKVVNRPPSVYSAGNFVWPTSRLFTIDEHADASKRAAAADYLMQAILKLLSLDVPTCGSLLGCLIGGPTMWNPPSDTAANPAFRRSVSHVMSCTVDGPSKSSSLSDLSNYPSKIQDVGTLLRLAFPNSGAYFGESEYTEPNWQSSFWGSNYARLQQVKAVYDPLNVFDCYHCVELPAVTTVVSTATTSQGTTLTSTQVQATTAAMNSTTNNRSTVSTNVTSTKPSLSSEAPAPFLMSIVLIDAAVVASSVCYFQWF